MRTHLLIAAVVLLVGAVVCAGQSDPASTGVPNGASSSSSTGDAPQVVEAAPFVTFADLCVNDTTSAMQSPPMWQSTLATSAFGAGSLITFDVCDQPPAGIGYARLLVTQKETAIQVVRLDIPANVTATPGTTCVAYSAWTNLPVIASIALTSELRAVATINEAVNYIARRCIL